MTQEEFKKLWEADKKGSGITFDDIADRAKEWGLFDHPKCCDINIVRYEVLKAAKCVDAEEFNPDIKDRDMAFIDGDNGENFLSVMGFPQYGTKSNNGCYTITLEQQQEMYDQEYEELMALPKEELVKRLIGEKPPLNVRIG